MKPRTFIRHYRINRSWGDSVVVALWFALLRKSYSELLTPELLNDMREQIKKGEYSELLTPELLNDMGEQIKQGEQS